MATQDIAADFNIGGALDGVPDAQYAPDGPYVLEVRKAEAKSSKGGAGKPSRPMIAMNCSITSGPFAGLSVFHNFVWTEENAAAQRFFRANLKALGINLTPTTKLGDVAKSLVGRVFEATLGHREYQGQISNQIDRFGALKQAGPANTAVPTVATPQIPAVAPAAPVPGATPVGVETPVTVAEDAPQPGPPPQPAPGAAPPF